MRFLIVANELTELSPQTDTGLGMAREALSRGHEVTWATERDFTLDLGQL